MFREVNGLTTVTRSPCTAQLPFEGVLALFEGVCRHPGDLKSQHLSATTHLHGNHMHGAVNIGAFLKYYIGALNIQLTEYNHNLRKAAKYLRTPYQILETSTKT